ncbi:MAG: PAS domain S-box protein [Thermomicrobiales bacterium]|nr:PAS domain S-box protein [Thermomicrobiales bacterium]
MELDPPARLHALPPPARARPPRSAERLLQVMEIETAGVITFTNGGLITDANEAFLRMSGYSREDIEEGRLRRDMLTPPEWAHRSLQAIGEFVALGFTAPYEKEYIRKDGSRWWALFAARQLTDEEGVAFIIDITDRKEAEAALRASEANFRQLADAMPQFVWIMEADGALSYVNQRWRDFSGLTREQSSDPRALDACLYPADRPGIAAAWRVAVTAERPMRAEARMADRQGNLRWYLIRAVPVRPEGSDEIRWFGTSTDVTPIKEAEAALRLQSEITRTIADNATRALFLIDDQQRCTYLNPAAEQMTGFSLAEVQGRPLHEVIQHTRPDGAPYAPGESLLEQALTTRERRRAEEIFVHRSGHAFPVAITASPILRDDVASGAVVEVEDLTELRLREALLQRESRLIDLSHEPIFVRDMDDVLVEWNTGAAQLYDFTKAEALGQVSHCLLRTRHPVPLETLNAELERFGEWTGEVRHFARDGREVVVESRQEALEIDGRRLILETNRDITEHRQAEAERIAFLDALAHDVKNPLGIISGHAQLLRRRLQRGETEAERLDTRLQGIEAAVSAAAALIDELLDVAHLRAGRTLALQMGPADLVALAGAAVGAVRPRATWHRILCESDTPALVGSWDAARLERVLANLLSNAVKYSPGGGDIAVRMWHETGADGAWACLSVSDQGVGIPEGDLPRVFDRFQRGGNVEAIGGTGMGLAGAWQIVTQHGGTLAAESVVGEGSVFTMRLPLERA